MKKLFAIVFLFSILLFPQKSPITVDDLWGMLRIGSADLSPDATTLVFAASAYSIELNKGNSDLYLVNVNGENLRTIVRSEKSESNPKFSPDGKKIYYEFGGQIWQCNSDGTNPEQLTNLFTGASGAVISNDGSKLMYVSSVYPDCFTEECNKTRDEAKEKSQVKASIFTELLYRHWNDWRGEKRSHIFLMDLNTKEVLDLTLGSIFDAPPISLGSSKDYNFSPDGNEIAFTMNRDDTTAISTNNDVWIMSIANIEKAKKPSYTKISTSKGNDNQPLYSPDGRFIAYCSMERAGFEADKLRLMLYDREKKTTNSLTDKFDRSVGEMIWSPDSKSIYFTSNNEVNHSIYKIDIASGKISTIIEKHSNSNILLTKDGGKLYFKQQRSTLPYEIFSAEIDGSNSAQITHLNKKLLSRLEMNDIETFWSKGADGKPVQSILVKPPFFDPTFKYPMILLVHGGPQGSWSDDFHYRWNLQMFAAQGYVVIAPNPRGSTGYGQKFTDEISGDWGGRAYKDIMNSVDHAIKNFSFIDGNNLFAAGASYGGYMINWIATQTNRFNALVSHAGVFNLESMYGTTEELWFTDWEFKGQPWTNRKLYEKFSPHRFAHKIKTPMLVVHGAYDFRVPEEQAFQLFTTLQRIGVKSKFLYFPDETHFVQKPQNARLWWNTVYDWFGLNYKK